MNPVRPDGIATSQEDMIALSQYGLTAQKVSEKICNTVKRAEDVYAQTQNHKVILDEQIQVTLPWGCARGSYHCRFCDHRTSAPGDFKIKNILTKAKITFDDHSLHQLNEHLYFGMDRYRIDPITASDILGLK